MISFCGCRKESRRDYGVSSFRAFEAGTDGQGELCEGVRGMHCDGRRVGAPEGVPGVRACGLLRLVEEQACDEALSYERASGDAVGGAGGGMGMVLCG